LPAIAFERRLEPSAFSLYFHTLANLAKLLHNRDFRDACDAFLCGLPRGAALRGRLSNMRD